MIFFPSKSVKLQIYKGLVAQFIPSMYARAVIEALIIQLIRARKNLIQFYIPVVRCEGAPVFLGEQITCDPVFWR